MYLQKSRPARLGWLARILFVMSDHPSGSPGRSGAETQRGPAACACVHGSWILDPRPPWPPWRWTRGVKYTGTWSEGGIYMHVYMYVHIITIRLYAQ